MFDLVSSAAKRDRKIAMNQPCHAPFTSLRLGDASLALPPKLRKRTQFCSKHAVLQILTTKKNLIKSKSYEPFR